MRNERPGYQFFMLVLCLYALAALAVQNVLGEHERRILDYADNLVCLIFFADFVVSFIRAENRAKYFFTWGWLDLLSSIPMVDAARWGRIARIARIFRVLRGLRATKILATFVVRHRAQNTFLAAALLAILLVVFCSIAVLQFETVQGSNIRSAEDAIWWAVATITTVGYGDRFPVTPEGRLIAVILMCAGVGLFGTFSGFLAAWFLTPDETGAESEIAALRREISSLRSELNIEH